VHGALSGIGSAATAPIKALGGVGNALGDIVKIGAGVAIGGVFGAIASGASGVAGAMITGNAEMERYETQLGTLLGGADKAKERLAELAKFGATTPFELPEVVRAEKVLVGFGLTGQKALDLTKKSAAGLRTTIGDIAAGTGASFEEVALTFGKFSAGATGEAISRLQEMGVVTREQLTEMGIQFSKSGELMSPLPEAMEAAVKIADKKFGGGMKNLSSTFEGQMSTLQDNWNALVRTVGQPIFEALKPQLAILNDFLSSEAFQNGVKAFTDAMISGMGQAVAAIQPLINILPTIATALSQVFAFMRDGGGDIETFRGLLNQLIGPAGAQGVIEVFTNLVGFFRASVVPLWQSLADAASKALGGDLMGALKDAGTALAKYGAELVGSLAEWAKRFVEWVSPFVGPMLAELGRMLVQLGAWLLTVALPAIVSQLAQWALAFVQWVAPLIPPLLMELGRLYLELQKWMIFVALPAIISQLVQWGQAFLNWVATDVLPHLPGKLKEIGEAVTKFLIQAGLAFAAEAGRTGTALLAGFMAELGKLAPAAWDAIAGDDQSSLKNRLYNALRDAIMNAVAGVKKWIDDLIAPFKKAWDTIKGLLDKIRGGQREANEANQGGSGESGGGGGGATASRAGGPMVGTQSNVITIDARGMNADQLATALPTTLATLTRTRVVAGAL
jgi:hypothetical protein